MQYIYARSSFRVRYFHATAAAALLYSCVRSAARGLLDTSFSRDSREFTRTSDRLAAAGSRKTNGRRRNRKTIDARRIRYNNITTRTARYANDTTYLSAGSSSNKMLLCSRAWVRATFIRYMF